MVSTTRITLAAFLFVVSVAAVAAEGASSYSTGFESPAFTASDAANTDGVLAGQDGWSGGAQPGFTNDDHDLDNGDGTYGDEKVTTADAHSGSQSWRYSRGYGSSGQGTPFSPALDGTVGAPNSGADYDTIDVTLWFKAVDATGDGSSFNLYQGSPAGDDRTGFNVYFTATSSGVDVGTYGWDGSYAWHDIALGLDLAAWHSIDIHALFVDDPEYDADQITYTVNSTSPLTTNTWTHPWRESNSFAYTPGDSLKFAAAQDGDTAFKGFYIDDISYAASSSQVIPLPAAAWMGFVLLGGMGGIGAIRRKVRKD